MTAQGWGQRGPSLTESCSALNQPQQCECTDVADCLEHAKAPLASLPRRGNCWGLEPASHLGLEQWLWPSLGHTSLLLCVVLKMLQKQSSVLVTMHPDEAVCVLVIYLFKNEA